MKHLLLFIVFIFLLLSGCFRSKVPSEGKVSAKVIEYKVEYLAEKAGGIPTNVLPGKMTLIFADHFAINRIDGFLGQFSLSYIANLKTKKVISLLKIFDKKYYYTGQPGEIPSGIDPMNNIIMTRTGNKKEIAGITSDEIKIQTNDGKEYLMYSAYIEKIKNPNITTPYHEIDDVLLEFYTKLSMMEMRLSASRLYTKEVEWNVFNIPEDYQRISKDAMEKTINELFR